MPYIKGQSGNPGGRPRENAELKAIRMLARDEVVRSLSVCLLMDDKFLDQIENKSGSTNASRVVASLVRRTIDLSCPIRAQIIFNYVLGKPEPSKQENRSQEEGRIIFETQLVDGVIRAKENLVAEVPSVEGLQEMIDEVMLEMSSNNQMDLNLTI